MSRKWLAFLVVLIALAVLALGRNILGVRAEEDQQIASTPPSRETQAVSGTPSISSIESPSLTCYRPKERTGVCFISMNYLYVAAASSQYIISMTVAIDNHIQAYHSGFFQTYMYIPGEMYGPGFKVTCGYPGASGVDTLGKSYQVTIRARDSSGSSTANFGSVSCPADTVYAFLPIIKRR